MSDTIEKPSTDLIPIKTLVPTEVFKPGAVEKLIGDLEKQVRAIKTDATTPKGRDAIKSLAFKVTRSKTGLDEMGLALTEKWRADTKLVNADRAVIKTRLEALATEVRDPLTKYEQAEADRVAKHNEGIARIVQKAHDTRTEWMTLPIGDMLDVITALEDERATEWQEFAEKATAAIDAGIAQVEAAIGQRTTYDAEQAELETLRKAKAEQDERDRIALAEQAERDRLAQQEQRDREIADKARADALAKAETDRLAAEQKAADELAAANKRATDAEAQASATAAAAVAAETKRLEGIAQAGKDEQARLDAAAAARARNVAHRKAVANEVIDGLVKGGGITREQAVLLVQAIVAGDVPHTEIKF